MLGAVVIGTHPASHWREVMRIVSWRVVMLASAVVGAALAFAVPVSRANASPAKHMTCANTACNVVSGGCSFLSNHYCLLTVDGACGTHTCS
jgi:hypothetical protein